MGLSRKQAALNLHGWMRTGRKYVAHQMRGVYIEPLNGKCDACAIGAIMLGKLGRNQVADERNYDINDFQDYGPMVDCPVEEIDSDEGPTRYHLGFMVEHLFEDHRWNFARIEHWLAECADLPRVAA